MCCRGGSKRGSACSVGLLEMAPWIPGAEGQAKQLRSSARGCCLCSLEPHWWSCSQLWDPSSREGPLGGVCGLSLLRVRPRLREDVFQGGQLPAPTSISASMEHPHQPHLPQEGTASQRCCQFQHLFLLQRQREQVRMRPCRCLRQPWAVQGQWLPSQLSQEGKGKGCIV